VLYTIIQMQHPKIQWSKTFQIIVKWVKSPSKYCKMGSPYWELKHCCFLYSMCRNLRNIAKDLKSLLYEFWFQQIIPWKCSGNIGVPYAVLERLNKGTQKGIREIRFLQGVEYRTYNQNINRNSSLSIARDCKKVFFQTWQLVLDLSNRFF
jgi:hypothetical protein